MKTAKDFLVQECANLQDVLEETLRLKYGVAGSKEFFEECLARLNFIKSEISKANEADHSQLQILSSLLNQLTNLVSRIERSSIGEYSWPFVEELKRIAVTLCTESTATSLKTLPQFHVLAGGGLDAYEITPEQNRPSCASQRIHTIVFPRTLKHFVLLHAILGHEVGHAMWRCSQHQNALRKLFDTHLFKTGVFSNPSGTAAWLYDASAPAQVKQALAQLATRGIDKSNLFSKAASWPAWREEILCDFIGLMTFGPSFVAAECNLLYAMDPSGTSLLPKHPLVGCRANYLLHGAELRSFTSDNFNDANIKSVVHAFWTHLAAKRQANRWFDVFTQQQIGDTTEALANLLRPHSPSLYPLPTEADLSLLIKQLQRLIPPVGFELDGKRCVTCRPIDFRHALYAGWTLSASTPPHTPFATLNRLCEHGIMQQRAVDLQIAPAA
jgi:hypothetical protein